MSAKGGRWACSDPSRACRLRFATFELCRSKLWLWNDDRLRNDPKWGQHDDDRHRWLANAILCKRQAGTWLYQTGRYAPVSSSWCAFARVHDIRDYAEQSAANWGYNWNSRTEGTKSGMIYLPMLWGMGGDKTGPWLSDAQKAIDAGAPAILGFNEPDCKCVPPLR